jgi:SAM-dependent methyltransferase
MTDPMASEVAHWNEIAQRIQSGERLFWLQHPRVAEHYYRKALVEGLPWQYWIPKALGRPAENALELGCGAGKALAKVVRAGSARSVLAVDLDESRFREIRIELGEAGSKVRFLATDVNRIRLEKSSYDLIYAVQSVHHIEELEHLFGEVHQALRPGGFCVLDEFVGPARFQWTDQQLGLTNQLLGLMPRPLRMYRHGIEKLEAGRSSVEEVVRVCASEAVRSDEIVPLFAKTFDVVAHHRLGGTIQHLLYSGIIQNFPDNDPATDHLVDCIDGLESTFIGYGIIPSDFALLIGRKK